MPKILGLAQVAIAAPELEALKWIFADHFGLTEFHDEEIPTQGVNVSSVDINGTMLEMIAPYDSQSGLHNFLERKGPGLHHIAFWVDDIEGWLAELKAKGVRLINETPVEGHGGHRVAFIHPKSVEGVIVELIEKPE